MDQKLKKKVKHFKEPPFMHAMRKAVFQRYPQAIITYGNITQARRKELGLAKNHCNDAIAISGIQNIQSNLDEWIKVIQIRKKKRSLHEANPRKGRKTKNTEGKRNSKKYKAGQKLVPGRHGSLFWTERVYFQLQRIQFLPGDKCKWRIYSCSWKKLYPGFAVQSATEKKEITTGFPSGKKNQQQLHKTRWLSLPRLRFA